MTETDLNPAVELDQARRAAAEIGIRHEVTTYSEFSEPEFVANPSYRCYVCQGMRAVRENGVYSPLLAHGVDKAAVRSIARRLAISEKPGTRGRVRRYVNRERRA